jgi:putative FmdB family regulatory protein
MPTYLYQCDIHNEFEHQHSITEELEFCPKCREEGRETKVKKLIASGGTFMLKGGGWAAQGYK